MTLVIKYNDTIQDIVSEVEELDSLEQKAILAYIRAKKLLSAKKKPINKSALPALTMKQIDTIKHKARK